MKDLKREILFFMKWLGSQMLKIRNYIRHLLQFLFSAGNQLLALNTFWTRNTIPHKAVTSLLIWLIGRWFFCSFREIQMSLIPLLHYSPLNIWRKFIFSFFLFRQAFFNFSLFWYLWCPSNVVVPRHLSPSRHFSLNTLPNVKVPETTMFH